MLKEVIKYFRFYLDYLFCSILAVFAFLPYKEGFCSQTDLIFELADPDTYTPVIILAP